jgi:hypothetical protein
MVALAVLAGTITIAMTFMSYLSRSAADQRRYAVLVADVNRWTNRIAESLRSSSIVDESPYSITFQVPVNPDGDGPVQDLDGDGKLDIRWGARRSDGEYLGHATVIHYVVTGTFSESAIGIDVNRDHDKTDVFDVGHLEEVHYESIDTTEGDPVRVIALTRDVLLREGGESGTLFSWDDLKSMRIRLFVSDLHEERPTFIRSETVIPLYNRML